MRFPIGVGIASLLMICSMAAQPSPQKSTPSQRMLKVAPEVRLQLPPNFTALPPKTRGLNEIVAQLPQKQSAYIKVTTEKRRSEEEAIRRLLEVGQESGGKPTFVEICGWPALERQYRVKLAQVMGERTKRPLPEAQIVQASTIAIAQGDTLIRFEATLQPGATAEGTAPIFALVRTISCPANPNPDATKPTIEKLKQELLKNPTEAGTSNPQPTVVKPVPAPGAPAERSERGALAGVQTSSGPTWSEIQITASASGQTVVVGSNGGTSFSGNYGVSFAASTVTSGFSGGDPTLATGTSGRFYLGGINTTAAGCANPVDVDTSRTGAAFAFAGNAAFCPMTGSICFPDQPQMAADTRNSTPTGDQLYVVWRNFPNPWWNILNKRCTGITQGSPTPTISCSANDGTTWGHQTAVGSGDWGRVTVGTDGFVYVTYVSGSIFGSSVMLNKFSSCASGLNTQPGFPVTVASFSGVDCPISGLDRCDSSATASPQPAVLTDSANHVFVTYAEKSGGGNDNIVVRHSRDGGLTWPDRTVANTAVTAHRFLPWICATRNGANVSWYDRRAATAADDSLTSYFFNTTSESGIGTERNISTNADSQKTATAPCCPKYGDYNGNACARDLVYIGWASATAPPGVTPPGGGINVFVEALQPGPPIMPPGAMAIINSILLDDDSKGALDPSIEIIDEILRSNN